jgi:DNA-binding helix-turn-helix protein
MIILSIIDSAVAGYYLLGGKTMARSVTSRIAELLSQKKMTQKQLACKTGLTESAISHYVRGDRVPRGVNLVKIANALETTTDFLLGQEEEIDKCGEIEAVKVMIARNAAQMSKKEKMELISILMSSN